MTEIENLENGSRIFHIDTGNLTKEQISQRLEEIKADIRKEKTMNGTVNMQKEPDTQVDRREVERWHSHGVSVWNFTQKILNNDVDTMRIPRWLISYRDDILQNVHTVDILEAYTVNHDCSKPWDKVIDAEGRVHYPCHSENSKNMFLQAGGDPIAASLIGLDMVMHTEKREAILERDLSLKDTFTLLIVSLAEVHANAELFGGLQTDSFKIKWKKIDKLGKFFCNKYFGEKI